MQVCVHCAQAAARAVRWHHENAKLRDQVVALEKELADTEAAFWELAGDVRLNPIHVDVSADVVAVELAGDQVARKEVA